MEETHLLSKKGRMTWKAWSAAAIKCLDEKDAEIAALREKGRIWGSDRFVAEVLGDCAGNQDWGPQLGPQVVQLCKDHLELLHKLGEKQDEIEGMRVYCGLLEEKLAAAETDAERLARLLTGECPEECPGIKLPRGWSGCRCADGRQHGCDCPQHKMPTADVVASALTAHKALAPGGER